MITAFRRYFYYYYKDHVLILVYISIGHGSINRPVHM